MGNMRLLAVILIIMFLFTALCCRNGKSGIYHTYYGDIRLDTMEWLLDNDGRRYCIVHTKKLDSTMAHAMGLDYMIQLIFFKPSTQEYFIRMLGSDGGSSPRVYFDPYTEKTDSIR